jgi:hypothetical protein
MKYAIGLSLLLVLAACGPGLEPPEQTTPTQELAIGCDPAFADAEACTMQYDPVCATMTDGSTQTIGNECVACAQTQGVVSIEHGECPGDEVTMPSSELAAGCNPAFADVGPDAMCTMQYDPVCATMADGSEQTIGNECVACAQTQGVVMIRPGEC